MKLVYLGSRRWYHPAKQIVITRLAKPMMQSLNWKVQQVNSWDACILADFSRVVEHIEEM